MSSVANTGCILNWFRACLGAILAKALLVCSAFVGRVSIRNTFKKKHLVLVYKHKSALIMFMIIYYVTRKWFGLFMTDLYCMVSCRTISQWISILDLELMNMNWFINLHFCFLKLPLFLYHSYIVCLIIGPMEKRWWWITNFSRLTIHFW